MPETLTPRHATRIPVSGPWITELEVGYVSDAVKNAWQADAGSYHARFEEAFANLVGRRFAIALPSCTSALHLTLASLDIGPGDEVIVPESTWIATAAPITYCGASPVFADIDPDTWCLDVDAVIGNLTSRTRAVIAVDLYGNLPDWPRLEALCRDRGIALVEDAAQAIGARRHARPAGSFGLASTFSFHGSKTMTTGEGGMLVTDDGQLYERSLFLRDHGRPPGDRYFRNECIAYKYRMSAMQAAMGLAQTERIEELISRKRWILDAYARRLAHIDHVRLNQGRADDHISPWMITAEFAPESDVTTEVMMDALDRANIDSRPFFHPLSSLPAYSTHRQASTGADENPVAYHIAGRAINLPSGLQIAEEDIDRVCQALCDTMGDC